MTGSKQIGGHVLRGLAMGAADVVPGVSGGTIALVLGIYERLIGAVRDGAATLGTLLRADPWGAWRRFAAIEWRLVVPVLVGIAVAVLTLASVLTGLMADHPVELSAVFFGLIVGSIAVTVRDVRRWDRPRVTVGAATAVVVFALLGLRGAPTADPGLLVVFGAGAVAICGMILPGVSGAFILLMMGMYETTLSALGDLDLLYVAVFGAGAVTGLALFGAGLKWLLERHHDTVMAALIGLMAGSLRVLWPWPGAEVGDPRLATPVVDDLPLTVVGAVLAAVAVYVLGSLGRPPEARSGAGDRAAAAPSGVVHRLRRLRPGLPPERLAAAGPAAVALGIVVLLGVLRVWAPSVLRVASAPGGGDAVAIAAIPLVVALAAAPAGVALVGPRTVGLVSAGLLVVGRFALPAAGGGDTQLVFATVGTIGGLGWVAAVAAGALSRRAAAIGLVAGVALDAALLVGLRSVDLVWRTETAATVGGAAVLALFAAAVVASPAPRQGATDRADVAPIWAWLAVGPALAIVVAVATPTRLAAATGLDATAAGAAVLAGHVVAVLAAVAVARTPTPRQGPVAGGLIALGLGVILAAPMPFETPPVIAAGTGLLIAGLGVAVARALSSAGRRPPAVSAAAAVVGLGLGVSAVAGHHLLHEPYVVVAAAVVVAVVAVLTSRDRAGFAPIAGARVTVALAVLAAVAGIASAATAPPPPSATGAATLPLRLVGYHLDGALDRDADVAVDRLAHVIAAEQPDVVALQGVDRGRFAAGGIDVLPHLAQRLAMAPLYAPGESEQLGVGLLVRHGVLDARAEPLPGRPDAPDTAALLALVDLGDGRALTVITTRLYDRFGAGRIRGDQVARVAEIVDGMLAARTPVVLVADLGAPPDARELGPLHRELSNLSRDSPPTSPSHDPTEVRQQVLVSADLTGQRLGVRSEVISEHLMVTATIDRVR